MLNRWHYAEMSGQRVGLRWADIYPLMDREFPDAAQWADIAADLEFMEAAVLDPSYNPHLATT